MMMMEPCCSSSSSSSSLLPVSTLSSPHRRLPPPLTSSLSYSLNLHTPSFTHRHHPNPKPKHHHHHHRPISAIFERFTERSIKSVVFSQREARALGRDAVYPQHLLLGLISEDRSKGGFLGSGITVDYAREAVKRLWVEDAGGVGLEAGRSATDVPFSEWSKRVFEAAVELSRNMGCNFIAPEHIVVGLLTVDDGSAVKVLKSLGVDLNQLAAVAISRLQGELAKDGRGPLTTSRKMSKKSAAQKSAIVKTAEEKKEKNALSQFCVDLTAKASEGLVDPVIGRATEIQRIVQILCRRTKNNPILLGEPGVGKTAIAEGLALRIAEGEVPIFLVAKRIMSLDVGLLMAGAKERGELETRVTGLISEVQKAGNVILFIDEVHTLIGSGTVGRGSKGSGLDIANLLKPSLGRGQLQLASVLVASLAY